MKKLQIDNKTRQIRISKEMHRALRILAAEEEKTIKDIVEEALKSYGVLET